MLPRTRSLVPQEAEMRRVFERFDENQDGVICKDELGRFMKKLGFEMSHDDIQTLVKTVDENSDGSVDFQEFYALYSQMTGGTTANGTGKDADAHAEAEYEKNLKQTFGVFDKDGDGFITVEELQSVLKSLGMPEGNSHKKCRDMIKGVDADGNGKVDFQEFKKLMSSDALHH